MQALGSNIPDLFAKAVGRPALLDEPLKSHSHFAIGGPADLFFEAREESELVKAVRFARDSDLPFRVIGAGTNLLFDDRGYRGLILRNAVKGIRLLRDSRRLAVSAGTGLEDLMGFCLDQELGGMEFLVGIPGTLGGAVYGNAGAFDQDIGQILKEARLLSPSGEILRVEAPFFEFSYRHSSLKSRVHILLEAVLEGFARRRAAIQELLSEYREKRKDRHPPWDTACAGSFFKNPVLPGGEKVPAAFLLDQVGAKQMRVGAAAVYSGHANFIINRKNARASEVRELAAQLKDKVRSRFKVDLQEEVIFLPAEP